MHKILQRFISFILSVLMMIGAAPDFYRSIAVQAEGTTDPVTITSSFVLSTDKSSAAVSVTTSALEGYTVKEITFDGKETKTGTQAEFTAAENRSYAIAVAYEYVNTETAETVTASAASSIDVTGIVIPTSQALTFNIPAADALHIASQSTQPTTPIDLIAQFGITAADQSGNAVSVTVKDDGGFDVTTPGQYTVTAAATNPSTGLEETAAFTVTVDDLVVSTENEPILTPMGLPAAVTLTPESCFTMSGSTITAYDATLTGCTTDLVIPNTIGGVQVTAIGASAFKNKNLTSVDFSNATALATIGANAFENDPLTGDLDIPASITYIDNNAFSSYYATIKKNIGTLTFEGAIRLGGSVFLAGTVNTVNFKGTTEFSGTGAFSTTGLKTIIGSENWTGTIMATTFLKCALTGDITIPATVTTIGNNSFMNGSGTINSIRCEGPVTIMNSAFYLTNVNELVLTGATTVNASAFSNTGMKKITGATNITGTLGASAFASDALAAVTLTSPNSFESTVFASQTLPTMAVTASGSNYVVDLNKLTEYDSSFDKTKVTGVTNASYNSSTGIATYTSLPTSLSYSYLACTSEYGSNYYINPTAPLAAPYTVTFVDGYGTTLKTEAVLSGNAATAPANPTHTGLIFKSWDKDFSSITANTTVTALWTADANGNGTDDSTEAHYTVTFKDYNGTTLKTQTNVLTGTAATAPANPTRTGYTFTGWDKAFTNVTSDLTVTAQYSTDQNGNGIDDSTEAHYTVTFKNYNGTVLKTQTNVLTGTAATAPTDPTRTGYVFTGWDKAFTKVTSDLTVTAQYSVDQNGNGIDDSTEAHYTVTFKNYDGTVLKTQTNVLTGTAATAPTNPTRTGYTFSGWDKAFSNVTSDLTVTAQYSTDQNGNGIDDSTEAHYTVTFKDYNGTTLKTQSNVLTGTAATAPTNPTRTGYVFKSWDKDFSNVTSDLTVTAQYGEDVNNNGTDDSSEAHYTVTFKDYNGTTLKTQSNVLTGTAATAPTNPTRTGYTFSGWDKDFSNVTSNLTVTAQYSTDVNGNGIDDSTENHYTVRFIDYDDKVLKIQVNVLTGTAATAPADPTRTGYVFSGWDKTFDNVTSDLTVTAQYGEDANNNGTDDSTEAHYTVTFADYNGTVLKTQDNVLTGTAATAPADPTRTGYAFTGWNKDFSNITANTVVTAQYVIDQNGNGIDDSTEAHYTVTFVDYNGTVLKTQSDILTGTAATAPADPTRDGYIFIGWDKDYNSVTSNKTITALYAEDANHNGQVDIFDDHFTVTFTDYNDAVLKTQTEVLTGTAATAPADPTRTGYVFTGWDKDFSNITADTTVKAQYGEDKNNNGTDDSTEAHYTVTFKNYDGTVLKTQTNVLTGTAATAPADPTRSGYTFSGWDNDFSNITSDLTVTAQYGTDLNGNGIDDSTEAHYTVTFKDYDGTVLKTQANVLTGIAATAPANPTRTGYTFTGWDKAFANVTSDLIVTAQYIEDQNNNGTDDSTEAHYTVTFKDYDGTVLKTQSNILTGTAATAPTNPTRTGYVFSGWDKSFANVTSDLTVTAQYIEDKNQNGTDDSTEAHYTVTFKDYNGTVLKTQTDVLTGTAATAPTDPLRTSYVFIGWDQSFANVTSDLTVTALYGEDKNGNGIDDSTEAHYTVTFKDYNGTVLKTQTNVLTGTIATAPANPTRTGYTFTGWDKDFSNVTASMTVTAQYAEDKNNNGTDDSTEAHYTVTFVDYNGTILKTQTEVLTGTAATAPADPTRTGYTFTGWDQSFANVTANLTVTAQYSDDQNGNGIDDNTEAHYTVIFKDYDGTVLKTQSNILTGTAATAPANPTRTGYTFTGWDKTFASVKADMTVTAKYAEDKNDNGTDDSTEAHYTVTFVDYNGTILKTQTEVLTGTAAAAPADPTRAGYTFSGWDKDFSNVTSDLTVTAQYSTDQNGNGVDDNTEAHYTVTFKDYDGTTLKTQSNILTGTAATAPADPTRTDYVFTGWDKTFANVTSDMTVTAQYGEDINHNGQLDTLDDHYTVTFVDYNDTVLKTQTKVLTGTAATAPADPTRTDYVFTGWDKDFSNITANTTVKALYSDDKNNNGTDDSTEAHYTVTFKDYDGTVLKTQTNVLTGTAATAPADPTRTDYTFSGWDKDFSHVTSDLTVTAQYGKDLNGNGIDDSTEAHYTVTFKDYDGTVLKTQANVLTGIAATAPADPTRSGYVFSGWDKDFSHVTSNLTVTAQYIEDKNHNGTDDSSEAHYTVTFKDYDGTVLKTQTDVLTGTAATAPADPTRTDYVFTGWDKDFANITADTTVTAQYGADKNGNGTDDSTETHYTVTFVDYNGVVLKTQTDVLTGTAATAPTDPLRTSYVFIGWDKTFTNVTSDLTVTALYGEDKNSNGIDDSTEAHYTVTFKDYNGTVLKTQTNVLTGTIATAPANPTRTGYAFTGWDKDFSRVTSSMTVTAQYAEDKNNNGTDDSTETHYTVTFVDYDGTLLRKQTDVLTGTAATAPSDPTRSGYVFSGWDKDFSHVTADMTVTAQYGEDQNNNNTDDSTETHYTVTFKDYNGTVLKTQSNVLTGTAATAPANPTRTGYTFSGWDKTFSNVTSDLVVTAQYGNDLNGNGIDDNTEAHYTVTFVDYNGTQLKKQTGILTGTAATAPADPTRSGYTFAGWNKAFAKVTSDMTVIALYAEDKNNNNTDDSTEAHYTVTFVDYDGTLLKRQTDVLTGTAALAPTDPTRSGYVFSGWDKDFSNITADTTVTAQYGEDKNNNGIDDSKETNYTVTFNDYDGTELKKQTDVLSGTAATAPANPTRSGYVFSGWDKDFSNITADTTVTAKYAEDKNNNSTDDSKEAHYTVTFVDYNGTVLKTQANILTGTAATAPADPTRSGYTFTGWDKDFSNITANTTVKALYGEDKNNNGTDDSTEAHYTVTFKDYDGTQLKKQTDVLSGTAATAPADPTRTGYVFNGWDKAFTNVTSDLTVTAQYTEIVKDKFTVIFKDYNGTTLKSETVESGSAATAPANPTRTGYTFTKWDQDFSNVTANMTVTAQYAEDKNNNGKDDSTEAHYTVTFVDYNGTQLKKQTDVLTGTSATAPSAPTRSGYVFTSWDKDFSKVTADMTVTAQYGEDKNGNNTDDSTETHYTVTFVDYDGTQLKKQTDVLSGMAAAAPADPTRSGYVFTGWDKDFSNITADTTVTAQYGEDKNGNSIDDSKETHYTVTFVDYDGAQLKKQTNILSGTAASAPANPSRTGYTFTGWDKNFSNVTMDMTVTAQYGEDKNNNNTDDSKEAHYTVTFVDYNGTQLKKQTDVLSGTAAAAPADPTRTGYVFSGWDKDFSNVTADMTVTAQYGEDKNNNGIDDSKETHYTVTFEDYDGTQLKKQTDILSGSAATAPANPTRTGYTFTGWDQDFSNITSNLTLTAQYAKDQNGNGVDDSKEAHYTVTFVDYNGTALKKQTNILTGTAATAPTDPTRTGYTFTGWDQDFSNVTADMTVTAQYTETPASGYTVQFVDYDGTLLRAELVGAGKPAVAPADPTRTGYTFTGWDKDFSNITSDLTVTAQYQPNTTPTATPTTAPTAAPTAVPSANPATDQPAGRTCQDDGYPAGYYWSEEKQACIAGAGTVPTPAPYRPATANPSSSPKTSANTNNTNKANGSSSTSPAASANAAATSTPNTTITKTDKPNTPAPTKTPIATQTANSATAAAGTQKTSAKGNDWSVLNLIATIITALVTALHLMSKTKKEEDVFDQYGNPVMGQDGNQKVDQYTRVGSLKILTGLAGAGSILTFLLTQDLSASTAFADKWTILFVSLLIISGVSCLFGIRWKKGEEPDKQ